MKILRTIKKLFRRETAILLPPITLAPEGFTTSGQFVPWSEIQKIVAYKLDHITTDEVRFAVTLGSGTTIHVSEEQEGFLEVVVALEKHFPSISGWQAKVIVPAFKTNSSVLYHRT